MGKVNMELLELTELLVLSGTLWELFRNYFSYPKRRIRGSVFRILPSVLKRVQEFRGTYNIKPIYLINSNCNVTLLKKEHVKRIFGLRQRTFAFARAWPRGIHKDSGSQPPNLTSKQQILKESEREWRIKPCLT